MVGAVQVQRQVLNTQPTGIDHRCRRQAIGKGTLPAQRLCLEPWVSGAFDRCTSWRLSARSLGKCFEQESVMPSKLACSTMVDPATSRK
jgi:hypothetical protein